MLYIYRNRSRVQVGFVRRREYLNLHTARFYVIICVDIIIGPKSNKCYIDIFKYAIWKELCR